MRVVVPYAPGKLHSVTVAVLESYGLPVEFEALENPFDYSVLMARLWKNEKTVVIVEQDVAPWPGAVEELHNCVGLWCSCSYMHNRAVGLYHMLGCTKLSGELMRQLPGLWDKPVHWDQCDRHLFFAAREIGQDPHPHRPPVVHLNPRELGTQVGRET